MIKFDKIEKDKCNLCENETFYKITLGDLTINICQSCLYKLLKEISFYREDLINDLFEDEIIKPKKLEEQAIIYEQQITKLRNEFENTISELISDKDELESEKNYLEDRIYELEQKLKES